MQEGKLCSLFITLPMTRVSTISGVNMMIFPRRERRVSLPLSPPSKYGPQWWWCPSQTYRLWFERSTFSHFSLSLNRQSGGKESKFILVMLFIWSNVSKIAFQYTIDVKVTNEKIFLFGALSLKFGIGYASNGMLRFYEARLNPCLDFLKFTVGKRRFARPSCSKPT